MTVDLFTASQGRANHFSLIRFVAATLVLFSHGFPLTGHAGEEPLHAFDLSFGQLAVAIFFVSSGFLVTGSLLRSESMLGFFRARVVRVYPGLIVANLITVFIIGLLFTSLPLLEYLQRSEIYSYLERNSVLLFHSLQYGLPGVFDSNPYPSVVNGSLWTLPREVKLYLQLGLLGGVVIWLARWRSIPLRFILLAVVAAFACAVLLAPGKIDGHTYTRNELSLLFFAGAMTYAWRSHIRFDWRISVALAVVVIGVAVFASNVLRIVLIPALVWWVPLCAYRSGRLLLGFNRVGDYSYGIYIYAFPVQQALVHMYPGIGPHPLFLYAFPIVLMLAIASWHLVEKPMLRLKRRPAAQKHMPDGVVRAP